MDIVNTTLKAGSELGRLCKSLLATLLVSFSMLLSPIAISETETITWILTDHLGSPVVGRDDSYSRVVWGQGYTPFGETFQLGSLNPAPRDIGYTGHYFDHDMQLLYAGARWYDPKVGRFLSPDAVRFHFGGDAYFNRYAYANNNPLVLVDSDGNAAALRAPYMAGNFVGRVAVAPLINYTISTLVMGGAVADYTLGSYIYDVVHNEADAGGSTGEVVSDREPGTDGKRGSTSGPGEGRRFKPETPEERETKEGVPCAYCGIPTTNEPGHPNSRERDHIDPKSRGGNNSKENERDSCRSCNRSKGARNPDEWSP